MTDQPCLRVQDGRRARHHPPSTIHVYTIATIGNCCTYALASTQAPKHQLQNVRTPRESACNMEEIGISIKREDPTFDEALAEKTAVYQE